MSSKQLAARGTARRRQAGRRLRRQVEAQLPQLLSGGLACLARSERQDAELESLLATAGGLLADCAAPAGSRPS